MVPIVRAYITALLLCGCSAFVCSQPYALFNTSELPVFYQSSQGKVKGGTKGVRFDSTVVQGSDTVYFLYPHLRDTSTGYNQRCVLDPWGDSWVGPKIVSKPKGVYWLFNGKGDTIWLETGAPVDSSWVMYDWDSAGIIEATVQSIDTMSFADYHDSVKTINLQVKNNSGGNITHDINDVQLLISKNRGFVQLIPFYNFPQDTNIFYRSTSHPLTYREVYNYSVGDEFEYRNEGSDSWSGYRKTTLKRVLEKKVASDSTTVTYTLSKKACKMTWGPHSPKHYYTHDTIEVEHNYTTTPVGADYLPKEPIMDTFQRLNQTYELVSEQRFNGRAHQIFVEDYYASSPDSCYSYSTAKIIYKHFYIKGCGYLKKRIDRTVGSDLPKRLIYFRKGNRTWGEKVLVADSLCSSSDSIKQDTLVDSTTFHVYPNPIRHQLTVHFQLANTQKINLKIYNMKGQVVSHPIQGDFEHQGRYKRVVDFSDYAEGLYVVHFSTRDQHWYKKVFKQPLR
jgi:hypothetical protein